MAVFKQRYKEHGEMKLSQCWYLRFRDYRNGKKEIRIRGFPDRKATEQLERRIRRLIDCRIAGERLDAELKDWTEGLSEYLRQRLIGVDLLFPGEAAGSKPILEHLEDYRKHLHAKGNVHEHNKQVIARIKRIVKGCGFVHLREIASHPVHLFLAKLRSEGLGAATSNQHLRAIKQFCKWLVQENRLERSPLEHLKGQNEALDRRHPRRALTADEISRLLEAANQGEHCHGLAGPERALLYRLAMETGLRYSELHSLTKSSFTLDHGAQPTVRVEAVSAKNRREYELPLRASTAALLREHLKNKIDSDQAFSMWHRHGVMMIKTDLKKAGIPYQTERGFADFHSLRHCFLTNLARNGVHPKVAQTLARHSDINLTMNYYTHADLECQAEAVNRLPELSAGGRKNGPEEEEGTGSPLTLPLPERKPGR